jgi:KaiC/GvpD/RAD55 family RecA-like ATPase
MKRAMYTLAVGLVLPAAAFAQDLPSGGSGATFWEYRLDGFLQKALGGQRQVVFVTGEAGIGKTTLVDVFQQQAIRRSSD